ncbi:hypothetical protein PAXINDRAFT_70103, partial [Paxillus involutus ATCC 200175]
GYVGAMGRAIRFIHRLNATGGISPFLFCTRGNRVTIGTAQSNYTLFHGVLGKKEDPIAFATHAEKETEREEW